jgi:hypothetical protein
MKHLVLGIAFGLTFIFGYALATGIDKHEAAKAYEIGKEIGREQGRVEGMQLFVQRAYSEGPPCLTNGSVIMDGSTCKDGHVKSFSVPEVINPQK